MAGPKERSPWTWTSTDMVFKELTKFQQHKTLEDLQKSGRPRGNYDGCERFGMLNQLQCRVLRVF